MINHQWLDTFVVLVEEGHFTRTAERLYMTQPGVSQHLKKLEQQVGVCLLNRVGKGFELTLAGERLYHHGLGSAAGAAGPGRVAARRSTGARSLSVCLFGDPGDAPLFAAAGHSTTISRPDGFPGGGAQPADPRGGAGQPVDLGIVTEPPVSPLIDEQFLGAQPLCLVVPGALAENMPTFSELVALGFIDHPDGEHYARQLLGANYSDQFRDCRQLRKTGFVNQLSQILLPVASGLGFAILPEMAVRHSPYRQQVAIVPLPHTVDERLFLIQKKHRRLPVRYQRFVAVIGEELAGA